MKPFTVVFFLVLYCSQGIQCSEALIDASGKSIESRFLAPENYKRIKVPDHSFAAYLRFLPLKPHGSIVRYHNGRVKPNQDIYAGVVDMEIGKKDLQQCADAVMRLRGEYLFHQGRFKDIHFNLTNGFRMDFLKWMNGYRLKVRGNVTWWKKTAGRSESYGAFMKYMEVIFMYAGTLSLSKELKCVPVSEMRVGDVFIKSGSPGHAVIVVDMAVHRQKGKKIFLLAQSYMPAQDIQVLINRNNNSISPWYELDFGNRLETPEWTFYKNDLKRFR